jgi:hypothetical protein
MNGDSRRPKEEAAYFVVQSGHLFKEIPEEHKNIKQDNCLSSKDIKGMSLTP